MRKTFFKNNLKVEIFDNEKKMGQAAASFVVENLNNTIKIIGYANLILGTGTSQYPLIESLLNEELNWGKINLFHLDEYIGLSDQHPASFRKFLKDRVVDIINPKNVYYLQGDAGDINSEIRRYESLLKSNPIDVACIGIGENGHIAFNDPAFADFNDPELLKIVELDNVCRKQQVGEGWFINIDQVPKTAVTLTIPAIMSSKVLCCTVPAKRKAEAVYNTLIKEINTSCPASIIRKHDNAILFLDDNSSMKILNAIN